MSDRRVSKQRSKLAEMNEELSIDIKNDLLLAFNVFKNERNNISKLKIRTLLFTFAMYKSSAHDINEFVTEVLGSNQEEFSYEDVCKCVMYKLKNIGKY